MDLTSRQEEILIIALSVITEEGLPAITIRNLAKRVGVTEPAIYRHFESKQDFFLKLIRFLKQNWEKFLSSIQNRDLNGLDELEYMLKKIVEYFSKNNGYPSFLLSIDEMTADPAVLKEVQKFLSRGEQILQESILRGQKEGVIRDDQTAEMLSRTIMATIVYLLLSWKISIRKISLKQEWIKLWSVQKIFLKAE